jgi:prepilin-type N-terminal cleavage/methylation domain-containing protein
MSKRGFTLIELLVVMLIVGLVGTLAAVAVNAARSKQRDAVRLSNVRQVQSALENYFNESNAYPSGVNLPLGDGTQSACLGSGGFAANCSGEDQVFLRVVIGMIEKGLEDAVTCGEPARNAYCYSSVEDGAAYAIEFELENGLPQVGLVAGANCARPEGMRAGECK